MRKLKILVVTLAMTLLLASPAFAQVFGDDIAVANLGGFVAIDSTFTTNIEGDTTTSTFTDNSVDNSINIIPILL